MVRIIWDGAAKEFASMVDDAMDEWGLDDGWRVTVRSDGQVLAMDSRGALIGDIVSGNRDASDRAMDAVGRTACACKQCVDTTGIIGGHPWADGWDTSDDGEWYCPECIDYTLDDGGQPVCATHGASA